MCERRISFFTVTVLVSMCVAASAALALIASGGSDGGALGVLYTVWLVSGVLGFLFSLPSLSTSWSALNPVAVETGAAVALRAPVVNLVRVFYRIEVAIHVHAAAFFLLLLTFTISRSTLVARETVAPYAALVACVPALGSLASEYLAARALSLLSIALVAAASIVATSADGVVAFSLTRSTLVVACVGVVTVLISRINWLRATILNAFTVACALTALTVGALDAADTAARGAMGELLVVASTAVIPLVLAMHEVYWAAAIAFAAHVAGGVALVVEHTMRPMPPYAVLASLTLVYTLTSLWYDRAAFPVHLGRIADRITRAKHASAQTGGELYVVLLSMATRGGPGAAHLGGEGGGGT